jgi:hypothetical protein
MDKRVINGPEQQVSDKGEDQAGNKRTFIGFR